MDQLLRTSLASNQCVKPAFSLLQIKASTFRAQRSLLFCIYFIFGCARVRFDRIHSRRNNCNDNSNNGIASLHTTLTSEQGTTTTRVQCYNAPRRVYVSRHRHRHYHLHNIYLRSSSTHRLSSRKTKIINVIASSNNNGANAPGNREWYSNTS